MKRILSRWLYSAFLLIWLPVLAGCGQSQGSAQVEPRASQPEGVRVSVEKVTPRPIRDVLILPGETKPWQDVHLASNQGGLAESVEVKEGEKIKKGQLIVKIDVSALKAALDNAQAAFKLADELFQRRKMLFERKIISREELDQAETDREVKLGMLRQARVQYEQGFLYSPIDGVINHLYVDPGEYLGLGQPVADIVNIDRIEIEVNVPEMDVRYLEPGQQTMVKVDAFPEQTWTGQVEFVAFKADSTTKTFKVKILVDNPGGNIRPGMIARTIFLRRLIPEAITAPLFALVDKSGERLVFVEEDGTAHARTVSIGVIEGDRVQITQGLEAGDHLIVVGQTEVEEGTKVIVQ